jgi:hypothetical protein
MKSKFRLYLEYVLIRVLSLYLFFYFYKHTCVDKKFTTPEKVWNDVWAYVQTFTLSEIITYICLIKFIFHLRNSYVGVRQFFELF